MPSLRRSFRERCREGPGPGGSMPAPGGTAEDGARAGDDIATFYSLRQRTSTSSRTLK